MREPTSIQTRSGKRLDQVERVSVAAHRDSRGYPLQALQHRGAAGVSGVQDQANVHSAKNSRLAQENVRDRVGEMCVSPTTPGESAKRPESGFPYR